MRGSRSPLLALHAVCLLGLACGVGSPKGEPPTQLLDRLARNPHVLPPEPDAATPVVMLTLGMDEHRVLIDGAPIPVSSSLKYERATAMRRRQPPDFWLLQTNEAGLSYHYWTPVDPDPEIRVNLPEEGAPDAKLIVKVPEMFVMVHIPFYAGGRADFYRADGAVVGRFRFGERPTAALQPIESGE